MTMPKLFNTKAKEAILEDYVYIGRGTIYGNPFRIGTHGSRDKVCDLFEEWIVKQPWFDAACQQLRGRNLMCHCVPDRCHGETWLKHANKELTTVRYVK